MIVDSTSPDWPAVFGRQAPLGVEVGFGMGHALLDWAAECPDWNLVGIEVYQPGIGALLLGLDSQGSTNVRVLEADARQALAAGFEPDFVRLLASRMRPGARLGLATDWQDYAQHMLTVLDAEPLLQNRSGQGSYAERPSGRPTTRFEERGRRLGHQVWDLGYERKRETTESR